MTTSVIDIEKIKAADYAHLVHPLFHPVDQKDPFVWVKVKAQSCTRRVESNT
jgi:hypothetical protein